MVFPNFPIAAKLFPNRLWYRYATVILSHEGVMADVGREWQRPLDAKCVDA